jgi:integrase
MARPAKPWYWKARDRWVVTVDGRRETLAHGRGSRKAAEAEFHRLMLARAKGRPTPRAGQTVEALFQVFLDDVKGEVGRGEKAPRTYKGYRAALEDCARALGTLAAAEILPLHVTRWLQGKAWGPTRRCTVLAILSIAFNWGRRQGYLEANPLRDMPRPRPRRRELIPTAAQVDALLARHAGYAVHDAVLALRDTGCRPCEVMALTAADVDLQAETWTVRNKTRSSTGKPTRKVYLTPRMIELSRRLCLEHPEGAIFRADRDEAWTSTGLSGAVSRRAPGAASGRRFTAYGLRHLFITDGLERGIPPATMAELVGHKSLTMIMKHYCHLSERKGHLREAVRIVRPA